MNDLVAGVVVGGGCERLDRVRDGARGADLEALVLPPDRGALPLHRCGLDALDEGVDRGEDGWVQDVAAARLLDDDLAKPRLGAVELGDVLVVVLRLRVARDPELFAAVLVREPGGEDAHGEHQADEERAERVLVRVLGDAVPEAKESAGEGVVDVVGEALENGALIGHGLDGRLVHCDAHGRGHHRRRRLGCDLVVRSGVSSRVEGRGICRRFFFFFCVGLPFGLVRGGRSVLSRA